VLQNARLRGEDGQGPRVLHPLSARSGAAFEANPTTKASPLRLQISDNIRAIERIGKPREPHRRSGREALWIGEPSIHPLGGPAPADLLQSGGISEPLAVLRDLRPHHAEQVRPAEIGCAPTDRMAGGAAGKQPCARSGTGNAGKRRDRRRRSRGTAARFAVIGRAGGHRQRTRDCQDDRSGWHGAGIQGRAMSYKPVSAMMLHARCATPAPFPDRKARAAGKAVDTP
jgi:hypothetical protein